MSGYTSIRSIAADNSFLVGLAIIVLGCASFVSARRLEEWADMALGIGPKRN
jgi:hypothetical protein